MISPALDELDREFVLAGMDLLFRGTGGAVVSTTPRLSVIMPVSNRSAMVQNALASLQQQTWRNFEVIAIDDGSTDGTSDILAQWAAQEPRLRVLTNRDRLGVAAARNRALEVATGEIITYLDSDNTLYPHALAAIAAAFRPETWSIYTAHLWVHADGNLEVRCPRVSLQKLIDGLDTFDLNVFAHRRALYEALGGFDERLTRLVDWELVVRYCKTVMPLRVPVPTGRYGHGDWPRVTNSAMLGWNRHLVAERHAVQLGCGLRVLYIVHDYPQVSQTHIVGECRFMLSRGVTVEIWSETEPETPEPDLVDEQLVRVHRGTLAEAITAFRPDIMHLHWAHACDLHEAVMAETSIPLTVRGHSFDGSPDRLTRLQDHPAIRSIYVFPTRATPLPTDQGLMKSVAVNFDPVRYRPVTDKDRRLVVRTAAASPSKDVESFIEVAARCKQHTFVLLVRRTTGDPGYLDNIMQRNQQLGSPVAIHICRPATEVAAWVQRAGIYLHSYNTATAVFGMPVSIAEAMATGAYVLARRSVAGADYLGSADRLYDTIEQAAALIQATLTWDDPRWRDEARRSIDQAFMNYTPEISTRSILDDWTVLTGLGYLMPFASATLITIDPDETIFFGASGAGAGMIRTGFHLQEPWGVWTGQAQSAIAFSTAAPAWARVQTLAIEAWGLTAPGTVMPMRVLMNGRMIGTVALGTAPATHSLDLAGVSLPPGRVVHLQFITPAPLTPFDFGATDRRRLGMALIRMCFRTASKCEGNDAGSDVMHPASPKEDSHDADVAADVDPA